MTARYITKTASPNEQYFERSDLCGISDYPFTMACWFTHDTLANLQIPMGFCNVDTVEGAHQGMRSVDDSNGDISTSAIECISQDGVGASFEDIASAAIPGGNLVTDTWYGAVAVFTSDTLRTIYAFDPISATVLIASDTGSRNFDAVDMDRFVIGRQYRQEPGWDMTGGIKNAALWSVALSEAQVERYLSGVQAGSILPGDLEGWWKGDETSGNMLDSSGNSRTLTQVGTATTTTDPKILVFESLLDTTNKTSKTVNFLDYNDTDYAGANVPGLSGRYVATAQHTDNNDGTSAESANSVAWEVELVEESLLDTTNKTSWGSSTLADGDYFGTAQHIDSNDGVSLESTPDTFTIGGLIIPQIMHHRQQQG